MSAREQVENVVLGGGEAGKYIAWELAKQGRPVMVIERALIGGSCPNIACLPSKNVIRSAKVAPLDEGKVLLLVKAPTTERKELAAQLLRSHGGSAINFWGRYTITDLSGSGPYDPRLNA